MTFPKKQVNRTKLSLIRFSGGEEEDWKLIPKEGAYINVKHSKGDVEWRVNFTSEGLWRTTLTFSDGTPTKWVETVFLKSGLRSMSTLQDHYFYG